MDKHISLLFHLSLARFTKTFEEEIGAKQIDQQTFRTMCTFEGIFEKTFDKQTSVSEKSNEIKLEKFVSNLK